MRTGLKITLWFIGGVLFLSLVFGIIGFTQGWFRAATDIVSPDNVKRQHAQVIGKYEDLIAAADNTCTVQEAGESEVTDRSATFVESPTLAYEATFRSIVADYNASVDNLFEAGIVAPPGYPESVDLKSLDTTDWCTVSDQLINLK